MSRSFYLPWTCCRGFPSGLMNSDPEQLFSTVRLRPTVAIGFRFFKGCVDNALKMFCSCCFPFAGGEKKMKHAISRTHSSHVRHSAQF